MLFTRSDVEQRLERGLTGLTIQFIDIKNNVQIGKLQRLGVEIEDEEFMVNFQLNIKSGYTKKFRVDLYYLADNLTILYGDSYRGDRTNIRRILKGN
jgi:hypothetical protein